MKKATYVTQRNVYKYPSELIDDVELIKIVILKTASQINDVNPFKK